MSKDVKAAWQTAFDDLRRNHCVDCVVLACTELRLVCDTENVSLPTFDMTVLHAREIADWIVGSYS